ncbi:S-adenosylmethionine synthetase [Oceanobacillus picturae]|uniref:S-adenosylmethionine synthetase n=1 Tax=Oceanobacillus picturae TaxID=171693 RepID=A0A0U9HG83_9BACI|nr:hypothetical protein [Oceanobacillus picturae]GAQ17980.1 S-adenosylmethionine synthetase [Oceanobacillus picturae]
MSIISFEEKRREKNAKQILSIPVYENLCINDKGELIGNVIDYVDMPKELIKEGD